MIDRDLDETPESYNLNGIADLSFGQEIHRFVTLASNKIQYMLQNKGRDGGKRRKKAGAQQIAKSKLPTKISGATAVLEREAARMRDIKVKKRRLEQQLGLLEKEKETELKEMQSSSDEDMPDLSLRGSLDYLQHVDMPSSSD
jgi:nucleosome binding factor SPN SPT16 subunit